MSFKKTDDKIAKIIIPDPREDLTPSEVKGAMETIVDENVFSVGGGEFAELYGAKIIRTEEEVLDLA